MLDNPKNILLLAWNRHKKYNWGFELFRRELAKYHNVLFYGEGYYCNYDPNISIHSIFELYGKPDVILTDIEDRKYMFPKGLPEALGDINDILKIHYCGDYYPRQWGRYNKHFRKVKYDVILAPVTQVLKNLRTNNISGQHYLFPYSVDTSIYYNQNLKRTIDVTAPLSWKERCRRPLVLFIKENFPNSSIERVKKEAYIKNINESKIFVTCNETFKQLSRKYAEALICGALLMADRPDDLDEFGYKDGEHLILYKGLDDLKDKINYFLEHDDERKKIAEAGMRFVKENHSNKIRIKELTVIIETELGR